MTDDEGKPKPQRRPVHYSEEIAAEIIGRLSNGETLRRICLDEHLPQRDAIREWVLGDRDGFRDRYRAAQKTCTRPSLYTEELAAEILERMSYGESVRRICQDENMPAGPTVRLWALQNREGTFAERYKIAQLLCMEAWGDEIIDIADDGTNDWVKQQYRNGTEGWLFNSEHFSRSRLRIESRRGVMACINPDKWGTKTKTEHIGAGGGPLQVISTEMTAKEAAEAYASLIRGDGTGN